MASQPYLGSSSSEEVNWIQHDNQNEVNARRVRQITYAMDVICAGIFTDSTDQINRRIKAIQVLARERGGACSMELLRLQRPELEAVAALTCMPYDTNIESVKQSIEVEVEETPAPSSSSQGRSTSAEGEDGTPVLQVTKPKSRKRTRYSVEQDHAAMGRSALYCFWANMKVWLNTDFPSDSSLGISSPVYTQLENLIGECYPDDDQEEAPVISEPVRKPKTAKGGGSDGELNKKDAAGLKKVERILCEQLQITLAAYRRFKARLFIAAAIGCEQMDRAEDSTNLIPGYHGDKSKILTMNFGRSQAQMISDVDANNASIIMSVFQQWKWMPPNLRQLRKGFDQHLRTVLIQKYIHWENQKIISRLRVIVRKPEEVVI